MPLQKPDILKQPEVGRLVKELRQLTGLTQEQFGLEIGVSYETVSRWENGRLQPSSLALRQLEQMVRKFASSPAEPVREQATLLLNRHFQENLN